MSEFSFKADVAITGALGSKAIEQMVEITYEEDRGQAKVHGVWGWDGEDYEVDIPESDYDVSHVHWLASEDLRERGEAMAQHLQDMQDCAAEAAIEDRKLRFAEIARIEQEIELSDRARRYEHSEIISHRLDQMEPNHEQ